ncbi:glycine--tRNA ligase subunit beta [Tissierella creatinophila]|uniref:Glycine--tRNA ligase beta subunit n=1 Tax=Tissierella creatinophila DSM 6911 TaxID=1123403 RepID=A0A1U7M7V4_TISCR|nr:glycine--tRNA ligase subunit beta [Tissierella creatinophila]OLS03366.1 glycine--tRNA ligase beta subunit [Tissierella creatinophila DSM 6911]
MNNTYLLEIGIEEIPARYVKDTLRQLEEKFSNLFKEENISFSKIEVYSTPRRLTTIIRGLQEDKGEKIENIKGPSKKISFNEEGEPSKALLGFMRGQGVNLEDISFIDHNGEEYAYAKVVKRSKDIETIIEENVAELIKSINFPKSMKWGGKDIRFARPIRWIVSLLDDKIISFDFEGIRVSNKTNGHRFLGDSDIVLENVEEYEEVLKKNFVIVNHNERKEIIKYGAERLAKEKGGKLLQDEDLLDEVTNLVEYPTPVIGRIKEEYLNLPKDVIVTPMKEHLRYFPVLDIKDRLLPYFITVRNGNDEHLDTVIKGNEKVLGARLEDAKFFFREDISKPLEDYTESLKNITFQEKLGTLYDKSVRIAKLGEKIGEHLEVGEETKKNIKRAAILSKADLTTKMVTEFTELQGKMGMVYASISGENEIVSLAIFEQYLPRSLGDELPSTTAGAVLSIADKLDSISGLFAIGIHPTGSQDPFALRRSALGIIKIILDKKLNLSLQELIEFALYIQVEENVLTFDYEKVKMEINEFFLGRIKSMFLEMGIRYDIIDSVTQNEIDDIYDIKIKANKLNEWLKTRDTSEILTAFNRVATLAKNTLSSDVKRDLLSEYGISLFDSYNNIEEETLNSIDKKEYDKALDLLTSLKEPIDNFLDNTMIMVDDEIIKNNHLSLLRKIYDTIIKVCDLSVIVN